MWRRQIGTVTVTEPFELRENCEVAAWYYRHQVRTGTYPVWLRSTQEDFPYSIHVSYDSVITEQHTPALFGGVQYGPSSHRDEGRKSTVGVSVYAYDCPPELTEGGPAQWLGGLFTPTDGMTFEPHVWANQALHSRAMATAAVPRSWVA